MGQLPGPQSMEDVFYLHPAEASLTGNTVADFGSWKPELANRTPAGPTERAI